MRIYLLIISYVYIFREDLVCKQPLFQGGAKRMREKRGEKGQQGKSNCAFDSQCANKLCHRFVSFFRFQTFLRFADLKYFHFQLCSVCTKQYQIILNFQALNTNLRYFGLQSLWCGRVLLLPDRTNSSQLSNHLCLSISSVI